MENPLIDTPGIALQVHQYNPIIFHTYMCANWQLSNIDVLTSRYDFRHLMFPQRFKFHEQESIDSHKSRSVVDRQLFLPKLARLMSGGSSLRVAF